MIPYLIMDTIDCGHGRKGKVEILTEFRPWNSPILPAFCDHCDAYVPVLYCDNSEGEYGGVSLCKPCIDMAFTEALKGG